MTTAIWLCQTGKRKSHWAAVVWENCPNRSCLCCIWLVWATFPNNTLIARFMGQHGAHLGLTGPRWAPCWLHELLFICVAAQCEVPYRVCATNYANSLYFFVLFVIWHQEVAGSFNVKTVFPNGGIYKDKEKRETNNEHNYILFMHNPRK